MHLFCYLSINAICLGLMWLSCYSHTLSEWGFMLLILAGLFLYIYYWAVPIAFLWLVFIWNQKRQKDNRIDRLNPPQLKPYLSRLSIATNHD
jgi:hypothetical protein